MYILKYIHTKVHTYIQTSPRKKSANSRFFSFVLGAFVFFRAFISSRSRAFFIVRARKRKSAKKARVPSSETDTSHFSIAAGIDLDGIG
jgi:hypothetical protein